MFDSLISKLAPHRCLECCNEGNLLCSGCQYELTLSDETVCYRCKIPVCGVSVCGGCMRSSPFDAFFVAGEYAGTMERLVRALKFERAYAAHRPLAALMLSVLPVFDTDAEQVVVVPVPTAAGRVRVRGYDQVDLLGRTVGHMLTVPFRRLLLRRHGLRQLGATASQRHRQAAGAFGVRDASAVAGMTVILVDDVVTTGATMDAAARVLKKAGAKRIIGLVAAYQQLA